MAPADQSTAPRVWIGWLSAWRAAAGVALFDTALVAATVVTVVVLLGPASWALWGRHGAVREAEYRLGQTTSRLAASRALAAELSAIPDAERQRLAVALPSMTSQGEAELIESLEALARDAQVLELQSVAVSAETRRGRTSPATRLWRSALMRRRVAVTATVSDYAGLKRLLAALENNLQMIDTRSLTYDADTGLATFLLDTYAIR